MTRAAQQRTTDAALVRVPGFDRVVAELVEAEQAEGWLARCIHRGVFLALNDRLIVALRDVLSPLGGGPVVEVCAGNGSLAAALRHVGLAIVATDASPPPGAGAEVQSLPASEALRRLRPRVVIGSFVPVDAGVNEQVLGAASVSHYLVLNVRMPGSGGALRTPPRWSAEFLGDVARWMITRHDFTVGAGPPVIMHGEAWLLRRHDTLD